MGFRLEIMKERILLFVIVLGLTAFIYIFQSYTEWGLALLVILMSVYAIFTTIAYKIKQRIDLKKPQVKDESYKPFVSIMIPAHNEETVIAHTIETVLKLDYPNFEIIAIDDRSSDNTASVIKDIERQYPEKVKAFIRSKDAFPGKSAVLNDALEIAKGEAILVFDADATMDSDFLTNYDLVLFIQIFDSQIIDNNVNFDSELTADDIKGLKSLKIKKIELYDRSPYWYKSTSTGLWF